MGFKFDMERVDSHPSRLAVAAHPFWRTQRQVRPGGKVLLADANYSHSTNASPRAFPPSEPVPIRAK